MMAEHLLELDGLSRRFGAVKALDDVTARVPPGGIGLLGPNGAGKTTLLKILIGLLAPTAGVARVLGRDVRRESLRIRQELGFLPETDAFVPGLDAVRLVSLAGGIAGMPRRQALRRTHEVLSALGLEEARYRALDGYSTGMRQRLKLAQALVHDPPLLILDEPTNGLDPRG
ncbi:MAG: ABC transporter ATP-binding protein, partial [Planctomycetes bacterium]|nr:ABC transporter ATP-binding protein [Planctomycetota bacterium]